MLVLLTYGYTVFVLAGTWGLWGLWQLTPYQVQFPWPIIDNRVFYFPAWQLLFITALVIGYHRQRLTPRLAHVSPLAVAHVPRLA